MTKRRGISNQRLLIAEDTPVNQIVAVELLKRRGYSADVVPDGSAAVEASRRTRYAAILMDIQMPDMDGYEATAEIRRAEPPNARVPIIAITAHALQDGREKAIAAGMDDYIPKPIRPEELDRVLERWLSHTPPPSQPEPPAVPPETAGALDPAVLRDLRTIQQEGGGQIVTDLLRAFAEETPPLLTTLHEATRTNDLLMFKRAAHAVNGIARAVGARRMASTCPELENLADADALENADALLTRLDAEWQLAQRLLATELEE